MKDAGRRRQGVHMHAELKRLSPRSLRRYLRRLRWLHACEICALLPAPVRLGLVHTVATFAVLIVAPPPVDLPHLFVLLAWAGSLAFATGVLGIHRLFQGNLERGS
jgi:hypothetical protein